VRSAGLVRRPAPLYLAPVHRCSFSTGELVCGRERQRPENARSLQGRDRERPAHFLSPEPFLIGKPLRAKCYCISCGKLAAASGKSQRCLTCQRKSRARAKSKVTAYACGICGVYGHKGPDCPHKPAPVEDVAPVKIEVVAPYTGLLDAPEPPPARERKYGPVDLSYLRRTE